MLIEPMLNLPLLALACAINSFTVFAGDSGATSTTMLKLPMVVTISKSFTVS